MNNLYFYLILAILLLVIYIIQNNFKKPDKVEKQYDIPYDIPFDIKESLLLKNGERGLFAKKDYKEGEVIEMCPTIKVDNNIDTSNDITNYLFSSHDEKDTLVSFGYCSLINHSNDKWNCTWDVSDDDKYVKMYALRDINKGEEFYSNYGNEYWKSRDINQM